MLSILTNRDRARTLFSYMDSKHVHRLDAEVLMLNGLFLIAAPRPHEDSISVTFLWIPPADSDHVVSTTLKPFPPERRAQTVLEGLSPGFDLMEIGTDQVNGNNLHLVISHRVGLTTQSSVYAQGGVFIRRVDANIWDSISQPNAR
ncbi:Hypothetical protein (plasmid) [Pseudomonas putida]|nr:Hypothetical protein [Pseudomonas putida]